jgi:ABC-type lipopolysaccharide export system ATPase subunit
MFADKHVAGCKAQSLALDFTERGYVISGGEIVLMGQSDEPVKAEEVKDSYLGA